MELLSKVLKEIIKGLLAFVSGLVGFWGYYPLLPAYFAVCSMEGRAPISVVIGAVAGILVFMPLNSVIRYFFILIVIGLAIRIFLWVNRSCDSMSAGIIAGVATIAMNFASVGVWQENSAKLLMGICEGIMVLGLCMGIHAILGLPFCLDYVWQRRDKSDAPIKRESLGGASTHKMESLAYAVSGLSDALFAMSFPKGIFTPQQQYGEAEPMQVTEFQEEICERCNSREVCWEEHHGQTLKMAWNNRLLENRYVIARQLDAMADLMQEWTKVRISADHKYETALASVLYGAKERGLLVKDLHVYEEKGRLYTEGYVSTRLNGAVSMKHYLHVTEKAFGRDMRIGADGKNILTKDPVFVSLYEETDFYILQGAVTEKKSESEANGDYFSCFSMDDGNYHICLSDGMGSGSRAKEESEMVVELMQKFIEAGFKKETAVQLLNSTMVLQGEDNSFSTLDYAVIDTYTGELELIKIGGAATFIKRGDEVECIDIGSLPAGADAKMETEIIKRKLMSGDFLVMVTDGMIEYLHVRNPKDVMMDMISRAKMENAQGMAEYIMTQVMILTGGFPKDDMTILVTGIWEK